MPKFRRNFIENINKNKIDLILLKNKLKFLKTNYFINCFHQENPESITGTSVFGALGSVSESATQPSVPEPCPRLPGRDERVRAPVAP